MKEYEVTIERVVRSTTSRVIRAKSKQEASEAAMQKLDPATALWTRAITDYGVHSTVTLGLD